MPKSDDPCKHAYPARDQCPTCSKESPNTEKLTVVYLTAGGNAYHFHPRCHALEYGQEYLVRNRGGTPAPIQTSYEHLSKGDREPCSACRGQRPKQQQHSLQ